MRGGIKGFRLALAYLAVIPVTFLLAIAVGVLVRVAPSGPLAGTAAELIDVARVAGAVLYLCAVFVMRSELEAAPIGMSLGGVMTFFFAALYFQYHLRDYNEPYVGDGELSLTRSVAPVYPQAEPVAYPPPPPGYGQPPIG